MQENFKKKFRGVGLSFRPEFNEFWQSIRSNLDCVEYVPEELTSNRKLFESTKAAVSGLPAMAHSTSLSVGSPALMDSKSLEELSLAVSKIGATCHSDHLCFRRSGEFEMDNFCLPLSDDISIGVILENLRFYEDAMGKPILLENISINGNIGSGHALDDEIHLFNALADHGCKILFDANNAFLNCKNFDVGLSNYLDQFPLKAVEGLHIAGHEIDDGWFVDSHMSAVSNEVAALAREVLYRSPAEFIILERDNSSATYDHLMAELDIIREVWVAER